MAPPVLKKKDQGELRKLMKERREKIKSEDTVRIDSPLAKYDDAGQLSCTVCNVHVKKESLWSSHIVGTIHRQNIEALKKKRTLLNQSSSKEITPPKKRKRQNSATLPVAQKQHTDDRSQSIQKQATQNEKPTLHFDYQDDAEEPGENGPDSTTSENANNNLPEDFFDKQPSGTPQKSANPAEALPQGFFDDPKMDAKIRKVEYKDPMDEEWERFQKTINEENTASQAIIEEEIEESKVEREIDEIDEQIHNWARVQALQKMKEEITHKDENQGDNSDNSVLDEQDYEDMLDWRAKGVCKQE